MKLWSIFFLLFFMSACAISQPQNRHPLPTEATYTASKDAVWAAVMSEIVINHHVQILDKESGFLGFEAMQIPIGLDRPMTDWVFMPDILFGTWEALNLKMNILVEEEGVNYTKVTIRTEFLALETNIYRAWIPCETNGRLEQMMLRAVGDRLDEK